MHGGMEALHPPYIVVFGYLQEPSLRTQGEVEENVPFVACTCPYGLNSSAKFASDSTSYQYAVRHNQII